MALVYGNSILDQRCIFHKLKNVGEKVRGELKGKDHKATRKTLLEQAALMYHAPHAEAARQRLEEWSQQWRLQAPDAVSTLERDVEQTLVFYQLETVAREWLRTTSLLERTNRELRRKCASGRYLWQCDWGSCRCLSASSTASCSAFPRPTGGTFPMRCIFLSLISTLRERYSIRIW